MPLEIIRLRVKWRDELGRTRITPVEMTPDGDVLTKELPDHVHASAKRLLRHWLEERRRAEWVKRPSISVRP